MTSTQAHTNGLVRLALRRPRPPFDCVEQTASKALALVTLRRVQVAFACPQLPQGERLEEAIAALLKRLRTARPAPRPGKWWRLGVQQGVCCVAYLSTSPTGLFAASSALETCHRIFFK